MKYNLNFLKMDLQTLVVKGSIYLIICLSFSLNAQIININKDIEKAEINVGRVMHIEEIKVRWKKAALENCPAIPCIIITVQQPTVNTTPIGSITTTTAITGGNVNSDGGAAITTRGVVWSTSPAPTISLSTKTSDGSGTGSFTSSLSGLSPSITYYVRAYASNSAGTGYGNEITFMTTPCLGISSISDIDGNSYNTVQIGTQCWIQSNLKVSKYRNGDAIPTGLSAAVWRSTNSGAYAIYLNNNANDAIYGKLYNWYAVADNRGLCPTGWHVPTDAEWTTLTTYLGGEGVAGGKMKSVGTAYWNNSNVGATNESGFSGLPGGFRNDGDTDYYNIGRGAFFWSATESSRDGFAWARDLFDGDVIVTKVGDNGVDKNMGLSVRCLRD